MSLNWIKQRIFLKIFLVTSFQLLRLSFSPSNSQSDCTISNDNIKAHQHKFFPNIFNLPSIQVLPLVGCCCCYKKKEFFIFNLSTREREHDSSTKKHKKMRKCARVGIFNSWIPAESSWWFMMTLNLRILFSYNSRRCQSKPFTSSKSLKFKTKWNFPIHWNKSSICEEKKNECEMDEMMQIIFSSSARLFSEFFMYV